MHPILRPWAPRVLLHTIILVWCSLLGGKRQQNLGNATKSDHQGPNEAELEDKHHHSGQKQNRAVQQVFA